MTRPPFQPFEEYMETVQKALEDHDPEVLLAVRLPGDTTGADASADGKGSEDVEEEDNSAVDATLISYGFEYIDASEPYTPELSKSEGRGSPSSDEGEQNLDDPMGSVV